MERPKRRCLKFVGYVYLPRPDATTIDSYSEKQLLKLISYHKERRNGRLKIYDDYNDQTITSRDLHFDDWSQMLGYLEAEYRERSNERLKEFFRRLLKKLKI